MPEITASTRIRRTPFAVSVEAEGVSSYMVYNKMLLPTGFGDPDAEYDRLLNGASMWDVSCQRQIELSGPDAAHLAQAISTRDMSKCVEGQGKYVAMCDHRGTLINDPIVLKLSNTRFWLSIADSDMLYWSRAIGAERGLDVNVFEAPVSPMAVQGPMAENVIASLFGDGIRSMKYFWFAEKSLDGIPLMLARSGWSKQGGFELYLMDEAQGDKLWNMVKEAGQPWGIGPGNPNARERIESGLLSWGGDTDDDTNPFEVRMGPYVDVDIDDEVVGITALRDIQRRGPKRHQLGLVLDGDEPRAPLARWATIRRHGSPVGHMTNSVWSPRQLANIGFALIAREISAGDEVQVDMPHGSTGGHLVELPFF